MGNAIALLIGVPKLSLGTRKWHEEVDRVFSTRQRPYHPMKATCLLALYTAGLTSSLAHAEDSKPPDRPAWLVKAEDALVGTWRNTHEATRSIPKVEIFREGSALKIRFWGRTHPQDTSFGPEALYVLSDHSEPAHRPQQPPIATAFATHRADFAIEHFTLRLSDEGLSLEGITLFTDASKRSNRIAVETFKRQ